MKTYYDPMIAKLAVWAEDRESSLKKLTESLKHYQVLVHCCVCVCVLKHSLSRWPV